jgi:hypothetical protein
VSSVGIDAPATGAARRAVAPRPATAEQPGEGTLPELGPGRGLEVQLGADVDVARLAGPEARRRVVAGGLATGAVTAERRERTLPVDRGPLLEDEACAGLGVVGLALGEETIEVGVEAGQRLEHTGIAATTSTSTGGQQQCGGGERLSRARPG